MEKKSIFKKSIKPESIVFNEITYVNKEYLMKHLNVSGSAVNRWRKRGLAHIKLNGIIRFIPDDVTEFLHRHACRNTDEDFYNGKTSQKMIDKLNEAKKRNR
jgi:hypothetical protein